MAKFRFKFYKKIGEPHEITEIEADDSMVARTKLRNAVGEEYWGSLQILSCVKVSKSEKNEEKTT